MPANTGIARRMEAAHRRIDAAVASLAPNRTPPDAGRNRGFAEVVRAEWLADTLEGLTAEKPAPKATKPAAKGKE